MGVGTLTTVTLMDQFGLDVQWAFVEVLEFYFRDWMMSLSIAIYTMPGAGNRSWER
jgi:hypothetical protein